MRRPCCRMHRSEHSFDTPASARVKEEDYAQQLDAPGKPVHTAALCKLADYSWPVTSNAIAKRRNVLTDILNMCRSGRSGLAACQG